MENLVVTMIDVLFVIACVVVIGATAVALIQGAFDHTHRRIYNNKKKCVSEVKFEEFTNMSYEEQIKHVEEKIQRVRETKQSTAKSIRQLEGRIENYNEQIETLLEMKFNVIHQQRMEEALAKIKDNVFGD